MATPYSAITIANTFLDIAHRDSEGLSPMKIQKLVYIAHGWHLALYDEPLLKDGVQAWKYGPVIREIYHAARIYGANPITQYLMPGEFDEVSVPRNDAKTHQLLEQIWDVYGGLTAIQLSALTHRKGTPWDEVWNNGSGVGMQGKSIDTDLIRKHYLEMVRNRKAA